MARLVSEEIACPDCNGMGWYSGYGHDCGGDDSLCTYRCPIQTQEYCETCKGNTTVIVEEIIDE